MGDLEGGGAGDGDSTERSALLDRRAGADHEQRAMRIRRRGKAKEMLASVLSSWAYKKFMTGCAILFPIAVTVYISWWFLTFFDAFFSPLYQWLFGFHVFGLGFLTSLSFVFFTGVFVSSWFGASLLALWEWIIKHLPFVKLIYSASKQISQAVSPEGDSVAFKEFVILRHPRRGEYAFGFITSEVTVNTANGDEHLVSVYVPTNHLYVGDVFLLGKYSDDLMYPDMTVREGIETVVSGGMAAPSHISVADYQEKEQQRQLLAEEEGI
mmetsp:Transcript_4022/g.14309  ORF Transcript_4022/g.14309 Transcript_4022/m.14309 type:complete len:268 (+) Transcript_4022:187-990(+)